MDKAKDWDLIIKPQREWFKINFSEIWRYRDLVFLFVRRDFVSQYKQTLLGPFWHIIQPLFTTFLFTLIFGSIAHIDTDGSPRPMFYLSGLIIWNLFSGCVLNTSSTFVGNAGIFGKIYFPRLVTPISVVISNLIRFGIQFVLFACVLIYFFVRPDASGLIFSPNIYALVLPLLLLIISILGMGVGIIVSSLTIKYRDLSMFVGFALQFLMYLSPVIYPVSRWENYSYVMKYNPLTYVIEAFRFGFMGTGHLNLPWLLYSFLFSILIFFLGVMLFNRVERSFMDTV